jgi:Raf kinase inhibitor-like YbhB/YbcL family protein
MPADFTCENKKFGDGVSPELHWTDGPADTQSYAIVLRDFTAAGANGYHWAIWNIPETINVMPTKLSGVQKPAEMGGAEQKSAGTNGYSYFGPCPNYNYCTDKKRNTDKYAFEVYAMREAKVTPGNSVQTIEQYLTSHAIAQVNVKFDSNAAPTGNCPTSSSSSSSSSSTSSTSSSGGGLDGKALFTTNCGGCHGADGKANKTAAQIKTAISSKPAMNTAALKALTDAQLNAIATFLKH